MLVLFFNYIYIYILAWYYILIRSLLILIIMSTEISVTSSHPVLFLHDGWQ